MRRIAFLHIGHPKTATTYLQHTMHLNSEDLRRAGVCVPSDFSSDGYWDFSDLTRQRRTHSGNASPLFYSLESGNVEKFGALMEKFASDRDVFLSSELLFYRPRYVELISLELRSMGYFVHVMAYIGSYVPTAIQSYCQNIRNGGYYGSLEEFITAPVNSGFMRYAALYRRLCASDAIDRVSFRPFHKKFSSNEDVVEQTLRMVAPHFDVSTLKRPAGMVNQRLPLVTLEALRIANRNRDDHAIARLRASPEVSSEAERLAIDGYYDCAEARRALASSIGADRRDFLTLTEPRFAEFWGQDPPLKRSDGPARQLVDALLNWATSDENAAPVAQ